MVCEDVGVGFFSTALRMSCRLPLSFAVGICCLRVARSLLWANRHKVEKQMCVFCGERWANILCYECDSCYCRFAGQSHDPMCSGWGTSSYEPTKQNCTLSFVCLQHLRPAVPLSRRAAESHTKSSVLRPRSPVDPGPCAPFD